MGITIKQRQFRSSLEKTITNGGYLSETEAFWRQILQDNEIWQKSEEEPVRIDMPWGGSVWCYKNTRFAATDCCGFSDEEMKLLIRDSLDKERKRMEKLKVRFDSSKPERYRRTSISDEVRIFVWQRDGGKCVRCGSNENLEYDHIIPVTKGGSSTARNIQLLCETCNRTKGDEI